MKRIIAAVSDIHAGSTVGLCCPERVRLDNGGWYTPSSFQKMLYKRWLEFWAIFKERQKEADWSGVLVNGDLVDGDHHNTVQIISKDMGVQSWLAKRLFDPVRDTEPDNFTIVRGTESHVGANGAAEESFARWLKLEGHNVSKDPQTSMYSWWHYRAMIGGKLLDATHHGVIGGKGWTRGNPVHALATEILQEHVASGDRIPDIAIRSHKHTYFDTHDANPVRVLQTPAWQLATGFAHKVVPGKLADLGGLILTFEKGKDIGVEKVIFKPSRPIVERFND